MRHNIFARTLPLFLAAGTLFSLSLFAQDPAPSVADAARRAREQKKSAQKPATVITDDTLKPAVANVQLGTVSTSSGDGSPATDSSAASGTAEPGRSANLTSAPAPAGPSPEEAEEKKRAMDALKQEIDAKQNEVDMSQRELSLDNDNYYSKPNYQGDKAGKARLDAEQADLNAKKEALAELKNKLVDMGGTYEPKPAAPPTQKYVQVP